MKKIAFLFPGQGSQSVGMGQDLYQEYGFVRELFDMVEEISKINLSKLCFKGPMEELTMTVNLQPAVTVINLACLAAIKKAGLTPALSAGHSLGEYGALNAAGIVNEENTFKLVYRRGGLMQRESLKNKGAMHAIIGMNIEEVSERVEQAAENGIVSVANHNMEKQIVITGEPKAVEHASSLAAEKGARTVPLQVSGAWHSELIRGAEKEFREFLETIEFNEPQTTVLFNATADSCIEPQEIREIMTRQLCSPVKWYDIMQKLLKEEVETFVEVGPGKVLTGLLRKTKPKDYPGKIYSVSDLKSFEKFVNENL